MIRKACFILLLPLLLAASDVKITPLQKQLVLDVPLTSGHLQSTTVPSDRTPYGNHLDTVVGTPAYASDGVTLDGAEYMSRTIDDFRIGDSQGTICLWFRDTQTGGQKVLFSSAQASSSNYRFLLFRTSNVTETVRLFQKDNDTADSIQIDGADVDDGAWHSTCLTSNGSRWLMYLDGTSRTLLLVSGSNNGDWFDSTSNRENISIGTELSTAGTMPYDGSIAFFKIWDREITATEVAELYNKGRGVFAAIVKTLSPSHKVQTP